MKLAFVILAFASAFSACTRLELSDRGFDRSKFSEDTKKGAVVRLSDYPVFDWDRLHFFGPYTPEKIVVEEVGRSVPFPHVDSEEHCLLVFLFEGKIASAFEIERTPADFSRLFKRGGYSRSEAVFSAEDIGAHHWLYVKK